MLMLFQEGHILHFVQQKEKEEDVVVTLSECESEKVNPCEC